MLPTRVQAKPLSGLGSGPHAVTASALATKVTLLPDGRHQRVSVAGFSSRIVVPPWVALNRMLGSSQHHHHHGKISRMRTSESFRRMSAVRAGSGLNSTV